MFGRRAGFPGRLENLVCVERAPPRSGLSASAAVSAPAMVKCRRGSGRRRDQPERGRAAVPGRRAEQFGVQHLRAFLIREVSIVGLGVEACRWPRPTGAPRAADLDYGTASASASASAPAARAARRVPLQLGLGQVDLVPDQDTSLAASATRFPSDRPSSAVQALRCQAWLSRVHLLCQPARPLRVLPGLTRLPRLVARGYLAPAPGRVNVCSTFLRRNHRPG